MQQCHPRVRYIDVLVQLRSCSSPMVWAIGHCHWTRSMYCGPASGIQWRVLSQYLFIAWKLSAKRLKENLYIGIVSFCLLTSQELEAEWSLFLEGGFEDCQCQCVMMKKLFVMALMIIRLVKIGWQWPTHKSANPAQDQGGGQPTNKTQNWNTSAKRGKN